MTNPRYLAILASALLMPAAPTAAQTQPVAVPKPMLYLRGSEAYSVGDRNFIRYRYDVENKAGIPAELFAPAPNLPPCGLNPNSSRTWVDIFDRTGTRLYGFCALAQPSDLGLLWFAMEEGVVPPSWIYIELKDRLTNATYRSNIADTTL